MCTLLKRERRGGRQEEEQHVSSGDVEATRVKEVKVVFPFVSTAGRVERALLLLFLFVLYLSPQSSILYGHMMAS